MAYTDPVNWQPISQMPLIAGMIADALDDTREHLATLTKAVPTPHLLDDATIDRSKRVHDEQMEFIDIYDQQITRWKAARPSATQSLELDRIAEQNRELRAVTKQVLALGRQLRAGTIDRIQGMSDLELGLQSVLGGISGSQRR